MNWQIMELIKKLSRLNVSPIFYTRILAFLFLCNTFLVDAFDVKVLLATYAAEELEASSLNIHSKTGFLCIDGHKKGLVQKTNDHDLSILYKNGQFFINDHEFSGKNIQIHTKLPEACLQTLVDFIKNAQHSCNQEGISQDIPEIDSWSYAFLINPLKNHEQYQKIYDHVQNIIESIVELFLQNVDEEVISSSVVHKKLYECIQAKLDSVLQHNFAHLDITSKEAKSLKRSDQARRAMLQNILDPIIYTIASDFIVHLPQKVLRNFLQEQCGSLGFLGNSYLGSLQIVRDNQKIMVINCVPLEDYLVSVLREEGWPGWSLEVNKVLAIACRTYLISKVMKSRALQLPYHIKNSVHHQTYKGQHRKIYEKLKTAVKETHNLFLAYDGKPIEAMFDSCCGGIIPAQISGYDFNKHPYLARSKLCNYCKSAWIYSWDVHYSQVEIKELLAAHDIHVSKIVDIKVTKKDKAGLVQELCITTPEKKLTISGKKAYSIFPKVHSFAFGVTKKEKRFAFKGKGYGHHMGLCQWGAMNMVKEGYDYHRVLQFYYPGAYLMQFTHS